MLGGALALLLTSCSVASPLDHAVDAYFHDEEAEGWVFLGLGVTALGVGAALLVPDSALLRSAAIPVALVGLIQAGAGGALLWRTRDQVAALHQGLRDDVSATRAAELARMRRVNDGFDVYKTVELGLLAGGAAMLAAGGAMRHEVVAGVGAGLLVQGSVMLALDLMAEARADVYTARLAAFAP